MFPPASPERARPGLVEDPGQPALLLCRGGRRLGMVSAQVCLWQLGRRAGPGGDAAAPAGRCRRLAHGRTRSREGGSRLTSCPGGPIS